MTFVARNVRQILLVLGAVQIGLGLMMAFAPGPFQELMAGFPPRNDHFVRDLSTAYLAMGLLTAASADRPSWRRPILLLLAVQYGLHAINHVIDVAEAEPFYLGPLAVGQLLVLTVVFVVLLRVDSGEEVPTP